MYRLIYKSHSAEPLDWETVQSILRESHANNELNGISGFLMASGSHFMQVIEGTFEDVNATYTRIARDPRHDQVVLLSFEVIDGRLFGEWGMKGIGVFGANDDLSKKLIQKYGEEDGGVRFPRESWLALSLIYDIRAINELPEWKR
jgi:hypothetical protein